MAVKSIERDNKLILELDNGEYTKLKEAMGKWSFKDYQSLIRFSVSMLLLNEDNYFSIRIDNRQQDIVPATSYITG